MDVVLHTQGAKPCNSRVLVRYLRSPAGLSGRGKLRHNLIGALRGNQFIYNMKTSSHKGDALPESLKEEVSRKENTHIHGTWNSGHT